MAFDPFPGWLAGVGAAKELDEPYQIGLFLFLQQQEERVIAMQQDPAVVAVEHHRWRQHGKVSSYCLENQ
jgi:hypothetical protein